MSPGLVVHFAVAVLFDALALTIWDVGTRPPLQLLHDLVGGVRRPRVLLAGTLRFAVGAALLVFGALLLRPALVSAQTFTVVELGMLVAALLVEQLVGPDLRRSGHGYKSF